MSAQAQQAQVFFVALADGAGEEAVLAGLKKLFGRAGISKVVDPGDLVGIKLHVGEEHNTTHVSPALIRELVTEVKKVRGLPFLVETSTLYRGERENAVKHLLHGHKHGFGIERVGAPMIMADGLLGDSELEVEINGELNKSVMIAREAMTADALIAVSHPTGHLGTGLGACIKNLGMGLASRKGKMRQHSQMNPRVKADHCRFCKKCMQWCPQEAITEVKGKAYINEERCFGCGECLAVCGFGAIKYDWNQESAVLQKNMAEHAYGVVKNKQGKCFFLNVLINMTKDCDCLDANQKKFLPDLGILASTDPVAIDLATLDLTARLNGKNLAQLAHPRLDPMVQLRHAADLGLGGLKYDLIEV